MRDLVFFFVVILGIWAENTGEKREFELRVGAGFCALVELGCEIGKRNRAGNGISIPIWLHQTLTSAKTASWRKRTCCACSCVRFQVVTSNGSVPLQAVERIHFRLPRVIMRQYEVFESYCDLLCWPLTFVPFRHLRLYSWLQFPHFWSFLVVLVFRLQFLERKVVCCGQYGHAGRLWQLLTERTEKWNMRHYKLRTPSERKLLSTGFMQGKWGRSKFWKNL